MGSNPSERNHSSYPFDFDLYLSSMFLDDELEPPVTSGRAPHPHIERTIFGDEFDGHRQSESLPISPHLEVQLDQTTNSSGQSIWNDSLDRNWDGPSTSYNLWDGSREATVSTNRLQQECISRVEVCVICNKSFQNQSKLKTHILVHTGERPSECTECGKSFQTKSNLKKHSFAHTDEKPFKCTECGNSFATEPKLMRHSYVHTGEKPFTCTICGKSFQLKGNLKTHNLRKKDP